MKWIVARDKPFTEVESLEFQDMIDYLNPHALKIRTGTGMQKAIMACYEDFQVNLKNSLQVVNLKYFIKLSIYTM
jgi:hypothetical protein